MSTQKYTYGDVVKVIETGSTGTVKAVEHSGHHYVYRVELKAETPEILELDEAQLELIRLANEDETGLTPNRYIS